MEPALTSPEPTLSFAATEGCCPNCGAHVPRYSMTTQHRSADAYACGACGLFEYSSGGLAIPLVVPVPGWAGADLKGLRM